MVFGRTELIISASKAKFDVEADGEVHLRLNSQKPDEKRKKLFFSDRQISQNKIFGVEKWNVGDGLKRVLAKFEAH